jgi:hypothetical protein
MSEQKGTTDLSELSTLATLPMPSHISNMRQAELHQVFQNLDSKIQHFGKKLEQHRKYGYDREGVETDVTSKCHWICKAQQHPQIRLQCIEQCTHPIVHFEKIQDVEKDFPIDVQRLRTDLNLRHTFERHQRAPQSIQHTEAEAITISDIYAMPIATVSLPEEAWDRAMSVMKDDKYQNQRHALVRNWYDRARNYPPEAKEELSRKIHRHDSEHILFEELSALEDRYSSKTSKKS